MGVLDRIGNTPLVALEKVVPKDSARVLAKFEWAKPTGSMKDRMARAVIEAAECDGRVSPGGTVVEYTAGISPSSKEPAMITPPYGKRSSQCVLGT